jgi:hypothetical protein
MFFNIKFFMKILSSLLLLVRADGQNGRSFTEAFFAVFFNTRQKKKSIQGPRSC